MIKAPIYVARKCVVKMAVAQKPFPQMPEAEM